MQSLNANDGSLVSRTPANIEAQVLHITPDSSPDELAAALDASEWLLARAKAVDALMKQLAISWIDVHGPFSIGDMEYSVGYSTTTKCLDVSQTAHTLLHSVGGDIDQFIATLISQPFKHATVRNIVGKAEYAPLFRIVRTGRLVHGAPQRILKRINARFALDH
jgi:hypothetical protein